MRLSLTDAAISAAQRDLGGKRLLRIAFAGGCGAMGFRLAAVRRPVDGDLHLEVTGVPLLLDPMAAAELDGAVLDYSEDEGFQLDHPHWGVSC